MGKRCSNADAPIGFIHRISMNETATQVVEGLHTNYLFQVVFKSIYFHLSNETVLHFILSSIYTVQYMLSMNYPHQQSNKQSDLLQEHDALHVNSFSQNV